MSDRSIPQVASVASTVGWLLGILFLLIGLATTIPAVAMGSYSPAILLAPVAGVAYCLAGYRIRKGIPSGAMVGAVAGAVMVVLMLIGSRGRLSGAIALHSIFVLLCIMAYTALNSRMQSSESGS